MIANAYLILEVAGSQCRLHSRVVDVMERYFGNTVRASVFWAR